METLGSRALLLQVSRLLPSISADEKRMATISRMICKLEAAIPGKAHGRQMFLQGLVAVAKEKKQEGDARLKVSDGAIAKALFARHARLWAAQSIRMQDAYNVRARQAAAIRRAQIEAELDVLTSELGMHAERDTTDASPPPLCMSSAALPNNLLDTFARLMESPGYRSAASVKPARKEAFEVAPPWPPSYMAQLAKHIKCGIGLSHRRQSGPDLS